MLQKLKRPSFKTILLIVNLIILTVPISSVFLFRIYENELIRQTETELISQVALIAALYQEKALELGGVNYGLKLGSLPENPHKNFRYIQASLDLSKEEILSERMIFKASTFEPDPIAIEAAKQMENILKEAGKTTLSSVNVLDYHGLVVANWKQYGLGLSLADNSEVDEALKGRFKSTLRARNVQNKVSASSAMRGAKFRVSVAFPVFNEDRLVGVILLSRTPMAILGALYQERHNLILAGFMVLTLMIIISLIASLSILYPVKKLAQEALNVADGTTTNINKKSSFINVKEIYILRNSISEMAEKLNRRSEYLNAFASGVSHEFKTPLTSIKGALELIGEHGETGDMDPKTKKKFEANIFSDLNRLERLVNKLLHLAKAETKTPIKEENINIIESLENICQNYASKKFNILLQSPESALNVNISSEVFETIIKNLIDNSKEIGADTVTISIKSENDSAKIIIQDNGPGFEASIKEKIFTPFVTTHKSKGGTGLGLSLAKTLLTQYRGQINILESRRGAIFEINLPLS